MVAFDCNCDKLGRMALGFGRKAMNFGAAVVRHAAAGFHRVDDTELQQRLSVCAACPAHRDGECELCGCPVALKATWSSERCPMELWQ
jgi:hypothetical protein